MFWFLDNWETTYLIVYHLILNTIILKTSSKCLLNDKCTAKFWMSFPISWQLYFASLRSEPLLNPCLLLTPSMPRCQSQRQDLFGRESQTVCRCCMLGVQPGIIIANNCLEISPIYRSSSPGAVVLFIWPCSQYQSTWNPSLVKPLRVKPSACW